MEEDKKDLNDNFLSRWSKKKSKKKSENEISKIESTDFNSAQGDEVSKSSTPEVSENDKLNDDELENIKAEYNKAFNIDIYDLREGQAAKALPEVKYVP